MKAEVWQGMCILALALASACASSQSSTMSQAEIKRLEGYTHVPADVKAFAADYVAAWNAKDEGRLAGLMAPQSRACITAETRPVYDQIARTEMRDEVAPGYLLSLMPVNEGNLRAMGQEGYFLVKPERELHIDYSYPNTNDGGQLVLYLVHEDGRWMSDFPCMTAAGIRDFKDAAADRERYKAMAAAIKEPLRSELAGMLSKHQTGEAEERYKAATGCDMKTAVLVINALDGRMP
ncbi:MAG: hypothetical protein WA294_04440 [Acidobacteriaceae bacterium]